MYIAQYIPYHYPTVILSVSFSSPCITLPGYRAGCVGSASEYHIRYLYNTYEDADFNAVMYTKECVHFQRECTLFRDDSQEAIWCQSNPEFSNLQQICQTVVR